MTDIINILEILLIIFIQGLYDFIGWDIAVPFLIRKFKLKTSREEGNWITITYRIIKETIDFPVTIYIMIFVLHFTWIPITAFYILKWIHSCDRVYNYLDKIFYGQNPAYWGYWRWWTFFWGIIRTNWLGIIHLQKGYTYEDYLEKSGYFYEEPFDPKPRTKYKIFKLAKGMVNIYEVNSVNNFGYVIFGIFYFIKILVGVLT